MVIREALIGDGVARIRCAGVFGVGSAGNPSGHVLKAALEELLGGHEGEASAVVVDFTEVEYQWGDGPVWAVYPAWRRGLHVTYLARGQVAAALRGLVEATGPGDWISIQPDSRVA